MPDCVPLVLYSFDSRDHSVALTLHSGFQRRFKPQTLRLHRLMSEDGFVKMFVVEFGEHYYFSRTLLDFQLHIWWL
jgi:predicted dehydrogenase